MATAFVPRIVVLSILLSAPALARDGEQQFASLGDFRLESGEILRDCRVGYRTFGQLDGKKSNAIVFPTWFTGKTEDLMGMVGPGKMVDSSRYYVVTVDALANGVSSSPSNSKKQPRMKFPRISIGDMVRSQKQLLAQVQHLDHVKAVIGISMGGMQTFQWLASFPDFMDSAIAIAGSPRLAPYDLLVWQSQLDAIQRDPAWRNGDYGEQPARTTLTELEALTLTTPEKYNHDNKRDDVLATLRKDAAARAFDANDRIRQLQAMMSLDATPGTAARARTLVIVSASDHLVTPGPAAAYARQVKADLLEIQGNCGHLATSCEEPRLTRAIAAFLAR
jgi:homoserine O-acetyltransferase/O-succinyltransferase